MRLFGSHRASGVALALALAAMAGVAPAEPATTNCVPEASPDTPNLDSRPRADHATPLPRHQRDLNRRASTMLAQRRAKRSSSPL